MERREGEKGREIADNRNTTVRGRGKRQGRSINNNIDKKQKHKKLKKVKKGAEEIEPSSCA